MNNIDYINNFKLKKPIEITTSRYINKQNKKEDK